MTDDADAAALQFVAGLGAISMIPIALGVQFGLLLWRVVRHLGSSDDPRLFGE